MARKVTASTTPLSAVQNHSEPGPMNAIPSVLMNFTSTPPLLATDGQTIWGAAAPAQDVAPLLGAGSRSAPEWLPMPRLQYKSFSTPDQVRSMPKGIGEIVSLGDTTVGTARWESGSQW